MAATVRLIIGITLATLVVIFTLQNVETTSVRILFWQVELSKSLLIFLLFTVGVIIGWIASSLVHFLRKRERVKAAKIS